MAKDITKDDLKAIIEGKAPSDLVREAIKIFPKPQSRFRMYQEILQESVPWKEKILLRIGDHLFIVAKGKGERVVKCRCGQEFGDYRVNWKYYALIRSRTTPEEISEVYTSRPLAPNPEIVEVREYYCPGCLTQLAVECCPKGYPPVFELLPDLDVFYREWIEQPLEDETPNWFQDRSFIETTKWAADTQ